MPQRIILQEVRKPVQKQVREDVVWLCDSLGFSTGRDIEHATPKTVAALLELLARRPGVQSEYLAERLGFSHGRVNYHVRSLIDSGFLYRERRLIHLRAGSVKASIEALRKDANRLFDELSDVAEEIDEALGYANRD